MVNDEGTMDSPSTIIVMPSALSNQPWRRFLMRRRLGGPDGALVLLGHRRETLVHELLQPLSAVRLGRVEVALRVGGDAVHRVELARLTAAVAEAREDGQRRAIEDVDLLVGAVGQIHVL